MDHVSRLTADSLTASFLDESQIWSKSKIYAVTIWGMPSLAR
jgi:hypothetical protein